MISSSTRRTESIPLTLDDKLARFQKENYIRFEGDLIKIDARVIEKFLRMAEVTNSPQWSMAVSHLLSLPGSVREVMSLIFHLRAFDEGDEQVRADLLRLRPDLDGYLDDCFREIDGMLRRMPAPLAV